MITPAISATCRKQRRHQALVIKSARMKVIVKIVAITKRGKVAVITEENKTSFRCSNNQSKGL